ncbi:PLP-dependent transferase [Hortaea werneckii]|nr:PLP-dependent transferase [Hortaea werneckii]KAI6881878.1 PLP-dependent transferase [Hortaea werneckii]KAI6989937.1 PLP-dependent transferase [Hortaea werneckii]KAI7142870.1 PLP-dependent transferase [Hortaea werneckii]KAI7170809.1 PLP-dependent transferase [Hortaea werneckii]
MDNPQHTMSAVQSLNAPPSPNRRPASRSHQPPKSPNVARFQKPYTDSSAEEISSTSGSEQDYDYQTDFTTPASSDANPDDMPDEVEDFRDIEYPQLKGKTYLDHGGTTLYAKSLIEDFSADMIGNLYGNPHSASTPSALAGHRVDSIRDRALRFFNADPEEFDLVFVANATAAIKMVIDCFKDHAAASNTPVWYGYHRDAHTSLVGIRESTKMHRCFTSDEEVDIWINSGGLGGPRARQLGLFAYPGQSNMTGRRLPLNWPGRIRRSFHKAATYTLLDAAALASTAPLDLSDPATAPDFVALSFYKIFGFPNIGALIVRKNSQHVLQNRRYFGGGTVDMIISINDTWHAKKDTSIHERLEDGTLPFHSIFALDHAMNVHERLYGPNPMKFISMHTSQLGKQLYDGLSGMKHANGMPVCRIYKDENAVYGDPTVQGSTIAMNIQLADGTLVGFEEVEEAADERNIYIRSGSLCNPGGVATYLEWSPAEMKAAYAAGHRCSNPTQIMLGKATGVVRASLGAMSTAADVQNFLKFIQEVYVGKVHKLLPAHTTPYGQTAPLSPPASPGIKNQVPPPLNIPHALHVPPKPQRSGSLTAGAVSAYADHSTWDNTPPQHATALPKSQPVTLSDYEKPLPSPAPPFNPADYVKLRKPWEEEFRRQREQNQQLAATEIKVRELEDHSLYSSSRNNQPSVKARKFGRSVVNLLRTKSHFVEQQPHQHQQHQQQAVPPPHS